MTASSSSKPSSAPPHISQDATAAAENWRANNREQLKALKTDKQIKDDINRALTADRQAILTVRANVTKRHDFALLDKSEQGRQMTEAVLLGIQKRIDQQRYASCKYSAFANFIPQIAFGIKTGTDNMRKECMARQLAAFRKESAGGYMYASNDDEDEIMPPTHGGIKQEKSEPSPYHERRHPGPSETYRDKKPSKHGDKTTTTDQTSYHKHAATPSLKRNRVDKSNGNKKEVITWRAVSRGQPLPPGTPAADYEQRKPKVNKWQGRAVFRGQPLPPGVPAANFQQRKPKVNRWSGRVVFRGQVMAEDDKDED
ncbi:hypothetical protein Q7P36_007444 [Cladosporium allicinum]